MRQRDPLANPAPLIRRVYSYVAYRIGDGPDAEDVTSEVFERALRYRASYDESRGRPVPWLLGIARRCVEDARLRRPQVSSSEFSEVVSAQDLEGDAVRRVTVTTAVNRLDDRAVSAGKSFSRAQISSILSTPDRGTTAGVAASTHMFGGCELRLAVPDF